MNATCDKSTYRFVHHIIDTSYNVRSALSRDMEVKKLKAASQAARHSYPNIKDSYQMLPQIYHSTYRLSFFFPRPLSYLLWIIDTAIGDYVRCFLLRHV